jgi:motility quorum-sensing regulator/GCU-specific mRNA interferase toxin
MLYMNSTTKWKPHYVLSKVKDMIRAGDYWFSRGAYDGADDLGLEDEAAMVECILAMDWKAFDKSITSNNNHKEWQDVYKPMIGKTKGYIKFKVQGEVAILSFKKEDDR